MPVTFQPPVEAMRFILEHVVDFDARIAALDGDNAISAEFAGEVLMQVGRVCAERLAPLNLAGDAEGCRLIDGAVTTPKGFAQEYASFVEEGWAGLSGDPEYGGQGLPRCLQILMDEMVSSANLSFGLFAGLTRGAAEALAEHGDDALKAAYLAKLTTGEWCGAMALTEANAGTDLGLLRSRAVPNGDGSFAVTGTKIFISSGDQDFGNNVIHLVLARLPDAAPGVKGISMFLVPKFLPDAAGNLGARNAMTVGALEHKMGIHAQPTCVMHYEEATGWLVGEAGRGLNAMFTMMNAERLFVGMQGLGIAEIAVQAATQYAQERLQGRGKDGAGPVPIIAHADVRKMIASGRAFIEPARALSAWVALRMDEADRHPDSAVRAAAEADVALLTPVVKAAFTDWGFETAVQAQQVFGGHGYVHEAGVEQFVRDARIAQIYEGTNGVQAMDLVGRKIGLNGGAVIHGLMAQIATELAEADAALAAPLIEETAAALALLRNATEDLLATGGDVERAGAAATDYLHLLALVALGWMWLRIVRAGAAQTNPLISARNEATARFFASYLLPRAAMHARRVAAGAGPVMDEKLFAYP